MSSMPPSNADRLPDFKVKALHLRAKDLRDYVGDIDMQAIEKTFEEAFERFCFEQGKLVDFEDFLSQCEDLDTIVATAHPTFYKSEQEGGHLAKLFTAYAKADTELAQTLENKTRDVQAQFPYSDPSTDEEGERLHKALANTITPGQMMQRAMIKVAQKHYPDQWKQGRYSPFNRTIWQKFDRDGRKIPVHVQTGEALAQRRLGMELIHLPQLKALQDKSDLNGSITKLIERLESTAKIYSQVEEELAKLDDDSVDMDAYQDILDFIAASTEERVTHPDELLSVLDPLLADSDLSDELFVDIKILVDNLRDNGLCFATPTHRVNAADVHDYLNVERNKNNMGPLKSADSIKADRLHFSETETMVAQASEHEAGSFKERLARAPVDGRPIHEMMLVRDFVHTHIDGHTIEKIDIAEAHNATTQRALRLAAIQYGVSDITDIGLLHEDSIGIDNAYKIYKKLFSSEQFKQEILHVTEGSTKKRARLPLKIGFSDFAKQHGSASGKPSNEKCLLQIIKAAVDSGISDQIELDLEFAGGEGPGRRVNPLGYEYTLKETVTPAVLAYAKKNGVAIKYRETIQGGDGCILLGTEESAAKVMATQLTHLSTHLTADPETVWDKGYFNDLKDGVSEHHEAAREAYHELYNDSDFALLMTLYKSFCLKGGSRKVDRGEDANPFDVGVADAPIAGFRAIGFNAASIQTGVHVPPGYGQGTAFFDNMERTEELVQDELFRERLIGLFMVRDLNMVDQLKEFIELYNPQHWRGLNNDQASVEWDIAERMDDLTYPDGSDKQIYSRLQRVVGMLETDCLKFEQVRKQFDFSDIEAKIAKGDYSERVAQKRELLKDLHQSRMEGMRDYFVDLESTETYSPDYSNDNRNGAIKAGLCLNFDIAESTFGEGFSCHGKRAKAHAVPIMDLCFNS